MAKVFPRNELDRPPRRSLKASLSACTALGLGALTFAQEAKADPAFIVQNRPVGILASWATGTGVQVMTGDFNGDAITDIALVSQTPGWTTIPVALSSATAFTVQNRPAGNFIDMASTPGVKILTGDFDGNGVTDIALVRQQSGWTSIPVAFAYTRTTSFNVQNRQVGTFASQAATPGVRVLAGDFDQTKPGCSDTAGAGCTDIALLNQSPGWGALPIAVSSPAGFVTENLGDGMFASWATAPGAQVITGDFDGNGMTDIALVRQEAGWTFIPVLLSTYTGLTVQSRQAPDFASMAATPGVKVLTGDFDGDGRTDIALVRQTAGWTSIPVALSSGTGFTVQNRPAADFAAWAATPGVEVVTGDFNADGKTDIALVNHSPGWTTIPVALSSTTGFTIENRPAGDFAGWATTPGVKVVTGEFNGDGKTDIALVNQKAGWTTVPVALSP